jgi:HK97 gp10 family phage protein
VPVIYNRLPAVAGAAVPKVGQALAKTAYDTEAEAKSLAPRDTGYLANSIMAEQIGPLKWRVYANADYALWVEIGTRRMDPVPYLEPALRHTWPSLQTALGSLV